MTWRPRDRCGPSMKLALRIFCFPVFYVRAVPCVLSSVHCTYGIRHIRHTAHVLCPCLSCVCIAMFCSRTHIWRQGCTHLVAVCFWGNTVLADFPSVVRRGGTVYGAGQYTHNSFPQFSAVWVFFHGRGGVCTRGGGGGCTKGGGGGAFLRPLGSRHPPFGWQALAKPWTLVPLCMVVPPTTSISMHTHSCPAETLTND